MAVSSSGATDNILSCVLEPFCRNQNPHHVEEVYLMLATGIPDQMEPEGWWGWLPKWHLVTSPTTKQNNVHKLITHLQPLSCTQSLKTFPCMLRHPWYVESMKKLYKWTYLQNRKRLTDLENELMVVRGKRVREFGMDMYGCVGWTHCI